MPEVVSKLFLYLYTLIHYSSKDQAFNSFRFEGNTRTHNSRLKYIFLIFLQKVDLLDFPNFILSATSKFKFSRSLVIILIFQFLRIYLLKTHLSGRCNVTKKLKLA